MKRRSPAYPSWPERQLLWSERDRSAALWLHGAATRAWIVRLLGVVSRLGDGWTWAAVIALLPLLGGPLGASASARMIGVFVVDIAIYLIVKRWIARPRPFKACTDIRECTRPLDEFSFPSGHTLHAVAFSVVLSVYYPAAALVLWPFTLLLALSRVVLGLHYPSDVLVGALIGGIVAALSFNVV